MLLTPFAAEAQDDATKNFVSAYEAAYGDTPNQFAADAYDAVYVVKEAIEKSGATPADGVSGICDKLKGVMTEITYDGLTGSAMSWAADGTEMCIRDSYVTIRDSVVLPDGFMKKLLAFYEQDNIPVVKETKRGHKEINLKERIYELSVVSCALGKADEEAKERIYMKLNASSGGNIKPGFVLESFCLSLIHL